MGFAREEGFTGLPFPILPILSPRLLSSITESFDKNKDKDIHKEAPLFLIVV